jgi:Transcriptional regulator
MVDSFHRQVRQRAGGLTFDKRGGESARRCCGSSLVLSWAAIRRSPRPRLRQTAGVTQRSGDPARPQPDGSFVVDVRRAGPRPRPPRRPSGPRLLVRRIVAGMLAVLLGLVGYAVWQVVRLGAGIQRSDILGDRPAGPDMNILLMGLDSRLDMRGNPLSPELYDALHAGDATDGGLNANVLMFVHIPGDGSGAKAFSIPRDDYVDLAGCPDKECKGKIKTAYGLAFDHGEPPARQAGVVR